MKRYKIYRMVTKIIAEKCFLRIPSLPLFSTDGWFLTTNSSNRYYIN